MLILRCLCCRRCASGWHSSWTVPASWAGFCSGLWSASSSCSSTTVLPSHPTAYTCCSSSPSEYGTALLFGILKELCLSGSWPWCLHGAGLQDIQVSSTFIFFLCSICLDAWFTIGSLFISKHTKLLQNNGVHLWICVFEFQWWASACLTYQQLKYNIVSKSGLNWLVHTARVE